MPRLLPLSLIVVSAIALCASAALAHDGGGRNAVAAPPVTRPLAPITVPAERPDALRGTTGMYAYVSVEQLAQTLAPATDAAEAAPGSVTVTATVLPVAVVQLDAKGRPTEITANTEARAFDRIGFLVRDPQGRDVAPSAATWGAIRSALAQARAGLGTIWAR